jgi:hypothetical protein
MNEKVGENKMWFKIEADGRDVESVHSEIVNIVKR